MEMINKDEVKELEATKKDWVIADTHFNHGNILKYCKRFQFMTDQEIEMVKENNSQDDPRNRKLKISKESIQRMNRFMIDEINKKVQFNDTLWHLGDFCWSNSVNDLIEIREQINCRDIRLIWGNHDDRSLLKYTNYSYFTKFYESAIIYQTSVGTFDQDQVSYNKDIERLVKRSNYQTWYLNHYANFTWIASHKRAYHLFGHSHGSVDSWIEEHLPDANLLDVGVDNWGYSPVSLDELKTKFLVKNKRHTIDHH